MTLGKTMGHVDSLRWCELLKKERVMQKKEIMALPPSERPSTTVLPPIYTLNCTYPMVTLVPGVRPSPYTLSRGSFSSSNWDVSVQSLSRHSMEGWATRHVNNRAHMRSGHMGMGFDLPNYAVRRQLSTAA